MTATAATARKRAHQGFLKINMQKKGVKMEEKRTAIQCVCPKPVEICIYCLVMKESALTSSKYEG